MKRSVGAALLLIAVLVAVAGAWWFADSRDASAREYGEPPPRLRVSEVGESVYPWHTGIVAATFWVGEVFDPYALDGSQMISAYDSHWYQHYGGCDGVYVDWTCQTEERYAEDDYWPTSMTPLMNPFYLDLPYDDVNDKRGFLRRGAVIPWAQEPEYAPYVDDRDFSLMKTRWVQLVHRDRNCYGQVMDAGPAQYHDAAYVFGEGDVRPRSTEFNGAGMDVSPALNACLDLIGLEALESKVRWRFVETDDVPEGPWTILVDEDPWVR